MFGLPKTAKEETMMNDIISDSGEWLTERLEEKARPPC